MRGCLQQSESGSRAIRRCFYLRAPELLWPAFESYILPKLMYGEPVWNPILRKDVNLIEKVQKRFTKNMRSMQDDGGNNLSYAERLQNLDTLSPDWRWQNADMMFVYKALHGLVN